MLNDTQLLELRRAATDCAEAGAWRNELAQVRDARGGVVCNTFTKDKMPLHLAYKQALHIAAANPQTVLELVNEVLYWRERNRDDPAQK